MQIEVRTEDIKLSPRQRATVSARVMTAFARLGHRVTRVVVHLRPQGWRRSRHCSVEVHMAGEPPLVVQDRHVNAATVVRRAVLRAWRVSVARLAALAASRPVLSLPRAGDARAR